MYFEERSIRRSISPKNNDLGDRSGHHHVHHGHHHLNHHHILQQQYLSQSNYQNGSSNYNSVTSPPIGDKMFPDYSNNLLMDNENFHMTVANHSNTSSSQINANFHNHFHFVNGHNLNGHHSHHLNGTNSITEGKKKNFYINIFIFVFI